jgi:hypothetical protein
MKYQDLQETKKIVDSKQRRLTLESLCRDLDNAVRYFGMMLPEEFEKLPKGYEVELLNKAAALLDTMHKGIQPIFPLYFIPQPTELKEWAEKQKKYTVSRMKREIMTDMGIGGPVPNTVASFDDLHSYVDANEYGGFCDDCTADKLIKKFGGRDLFNAGMPSAYIDFMDQCQQEVDKWLKERAKTFKVLRPESADSKEV